MLVKIRGLGPCLISVRRLDVGDNGPPGIETSRGQIQEPKTWPDPFTALRGLDSRDGGETDRPWPRGDASSISASAQVRAAVAVVPDDVARDFAVSPRRELRALVFDSGPPMRRLGWDLVLAAAETDELIHIRRAAAEAAAREAVWTSRHDVLHRLARSRYGDVRASGLTGLVRAGRADEAVRYLADDAVLVRALARDAARRTGEDPTAWYRAQLSTEEAPPVGAVAGLAESGGLADADLLERWLDHPHPRGRMWAVRGLRQRDRVPVDRLVPMLQDPSRLVVREVTAALRPHARLVSADLLWHLLARADRTPVRRAAYVLLREGDTWTRLHAGVVLAGDPDAKLAKRARNDIRDWLQRDAPAAHAPPSAEVRTAVAELVRSTASGLDPETVRRLQAHLEAPGVSHQPVNVRGRAPAR